MGEGGNIALINATPYNWRQTNIQSYQMNSWNFPQNIAPKATVGVYIEWDDSVFDDTDDDGGEVYFALDGTSNTFQIQASSSGGRHLQAYFDNIATANNPQGTTMNLGWSHDGYVPFVLSGTTNNFWSTNPPVAWMQGLLPVIGSQSLRRIAMPGSHDSGMSVITGGTALGDAQNAQTQSVSIGAQLALGARYFDMRPVITGGKYGTGHYSNLAVVGWQGANGQLVDDIISQVNQFTATNAELVILKLSHSLNTDNGRTYTTFVQSEWDGLLQKMLGLNHLYVAPNPTSVDLSTLSLNSFIGNGKAAVVVLVDGSDITLGSYANLGFYLFSQFPVYDSYTGTDDVDTMTSDQLSKMQSQKTSPNDPPFLLSWTLTQQAEEIVDGLTILALANEANNVLYSTLPPAMTSNSFPNIIYMDNILDTNAASLAVAINHMYAASSSVAQAPQPVNVVPSSALSSIGASRSAGSFSSVGSFSSSHSAVSSPASTPNATHPLSSSILNSTHLLSSSLATNTGHPASSPATSVTSLRPPSATAARRRATRMHKRRLRSYNPPVFKL